MDKDNWNNHVKKENLNEWHKIDKDNFVAPKSNTNIIFFTKNGGVFCGHYKSSTGFTVYGIGAKELQDVEVTHWRNLDFPIEFQHMLDEMDEKFEETITNKNKQHENKQFI